MRRILVLGATGETGRRVVTRLQARGVAVRVLARDPPRATALLGDVEVRAGDVREPGSLAGLADGVDGVICAMGSRSYFGANGGAVVDGRGTQHVMAACAGVPHFVYLGAFGLDRHALALDVFSLVFNRYFRWKAEAEAAVRASGVPYTIVRAVELTNRAPRGGPRLNQAAPLSLWRRVSRALVAKVLVASVGRPQAMAKTFELCEGSDSSFATQLAAMQVDGCRPVPTRTPLCAIC